MKRVLILLILASLSLAARGGIPTSNMAATKQAATDDIPASESQGALPFAMAITANGEYAYIGFELSEHVFKIRLEDFTVETVADLSEYFPIESYHVFLDASEKKLFVHSNSWRKLLVLDTETMTVIHTIDNIGTVIPKGMIRSQYGPFLIIWDGGGMVRFVNMDTYAMTEFRDDRIGFLQIQESNYDQNKWYVTIQQGPGGPWVIGLYDYKAKAWNRTITIPVEGETPGIWDLQVLPNERKVYAAVFGGKYPDYHAYGWLYSIDLATWEVRVIPVDGGAGCLEASPDSQRLYVGTHMPMPNDMNNILVVDTQSDTIVGSISLGRTRYGWAHVGINDLKVDPANPHVLYTTSTDGNAFIKANLDSLILANLLIFNKEDFQPHFFVKQPTQATGYLLIHKSANAFRLDLDQAAIEGVVKFPRIRTDAYAYDAAIYHTDRLLVAQGETVLEVDAKDMRLLETHQLPPGIPAVWHFTLSNDQTKLYTISQDRGATGNQPNVFLALNTANFQVAAQFKLEGGAFEFRPFELPDSSKLYALGGLDNGPITIHVIKTDDYSIIKTLIYTYPDPALQEGISAGPYYPYAYDSSSHTLFVGATHVVLAIDTNTDVIKKVIYLGDTARAIGLEPQQLIYVNAIGLVYHPQENYLYIAHLDRSFVSIYDLNNNRFLPKLIPLKGYFPTYAFANDDHSKIYTLNMRSDNVSVIDVNSKTVEKVIDLHMYLHKLYLPIVLKSAR